MDVAHECKETLISLLSEINENEFSFSLNIGLFEKNIRFK
jgi:hypothetical protein